MPTLISQPSTVEAAGTLPKTVAGYAGRVNTGTDDVSIALMTSPTGWQEPGQRPKFAEWTVVLRGVLVLDMSGQPEVAAGQAVKVEVGSGCATGPRTRAAPSTCRCACPHSHPIRCAATTRSIDDYKIQ
jgi:hypothetical protein